MEIVIGGGVSQILLAYLGGGVEVALLLQVDLLVHETLAIGIHAAVQVCEEGSHLAVRRERFHKGSRRREADGSLDVLGIELDVGIRATSLALWIRKIATLGWMFRT